MCEGQTRRDYLPCIRLVGNLTRQYPNQGALLLPPQPHTITILSDKDIECRSLAISEPAWCPGRARFYIKYKKGINTDLLEGEAMQPGRAGKHSLNVLSLQSSGGTMQRASEVLIILSDLYLYTSSKRLTGDLLLMRPWQTKQPPCTRSGKGEGERIHINCHLVLPLETKV